MSRPPRVSVIIPTYNRAGLLPLAIESVLAQTFRDFELILVDDGSTDETPAVARRYQASQPDRVRYFVKPNGGCASARNYGLREARGEYVAFLDSDDWFLPRKLEAQAEILDRTGAHVVFGPWFHYVVAGGAYQGPDYPVAFHRPQQFAQEHFLNTKFSLTCALVRSGCFQLRGGAFDETMRWNEDSDLVQRMAVEWPHWVTSEAPTFVWRIHAGSKSRDRVKIYENLIRSAIGVGALYPEFKTTLGPAYGRRLSALWRKLSRARLSQTCWQAARDLQESGRSQPRRQFWVGLQIRAAQFAAWLLADDGPTLREILSARVAAVLGEPAKQSLKRLLGPRRPARLTLLPDTVPGAPPATVVYGPRH